MTLLLVRVFMAIHSRLWNSQTEVEMMAKLGLLLELLEGRGEVYSRGEKHDREVNDLITFLYTYQPSSISFYTTMWAEGMPEY